jgi:hypothetical protein
LTLATVGSDGETTGKPVGEDHTQQQGHNQLEFEPPQIALGDDEKRNPCRLELITFGQYYTK